MLWELNSGDEKAMQLQMILSTDLKGVEIGGYGMDGIVKTPLLDARGIDPIDCFLLI